MVGDFSDLRQRDGISLQMERESVKCYGNAIVPQVAQVFIESFLGAAIDFSPVLE